MYCLISNANMTYMISKKINISKVRYLNDVHNNLLLKKRNINKRK